MFDSRNRFGWCLKDSFTGIPDKKKYICVPILLDFRHPPKKKNYLNGNENWNASDSISLLNFLNGLED